MLRKVLIAAALLIIAIVGLAIYGIHHLDSRMARDSRAALEKLQPGVIRGSGLFEKAPFYSASDLGEIGQILVGWPADREGAALMIVGNEGAHFLDARARLNRQIRFSKIVPTTVEAVQIDSTGDYGFLTRDQSWAVDVILFDKTGQEQWSYSTGILTGIDDSAMGDIGGVGASKVVVGLNGSGGLVVLDKDGRKLWGKQRETSGMSNS